MKNADITVLFKKETENGVAQYTADYRIEAQSRICRRQDEGNAIKYREADSSLPADYATIALEMMTLLSSRTPFGLKPWPEPIFAGSVTVRAEFEGFGEDADKYLLSNLVNMINREQADTVARYF